MLNTKMNISATQSNFSPLPMGVYTLQISDVNEKKKFNKFKAVEENVLNYSYLVLSDGKAEDGSSTRGRRLWHAVTPSLNSKSWLFKLAKAALGRELTAEESRGFDPESLVGKQVDAVVTQAPSADGTVVYNNILSYAKTAKPLETLDVESKVGTTVKESQPLNIDLDGELSK